jgi:WD40 repeat protein
LFLIFQGHTKSVSAVSFSTDGKLICSFSALENCLKFWQPYAGFFGTLVGALGGTSAAHATSAAFANMSSGGKLKAYRSFNVGPPSNVQISSILEHVRLKWLDERGIQLNSVDNFELVFHV